MIKKEYTIEAVEYIDGGDDSAAEARAKYKGKFPGRSARRMTHLGMLVGLCLQKMDIERNVPLIYASASAESASMENFIDSFPHASPSLFQGSIHPSAVEQSLIPMKQAIDRFYPIISHSNLPARALENCFLLGDESVVLVGGEERGSWLRECNLVGDDSFAFGIKIGQSGKGIGRISLDSTEPLKFDEACDLASFAKIIELRKSLKLPSVVLDSWIRIDWT